MKRDCRNLKPLLSLSPLAREDNMTAGSPPGAAGRDGLIRRVVEAVSCSPTFVFRN